MEAALGQGPSPERDMFRQVWEAQAGGPAQAGPAAQQHWPAGAALEPP
jgi:hypothetical protein